MADWVIYDVGAAAETLPPALATAYAAWLSAEMRAERLGLIASGAVADYRAAVNADADSTGKENADSLPVSCLRHAAAVVWYTLAFEMGEDEEPYRTLWQDAEIYLRRLYQDLKAGGTVSGATGTPLYSPGTARGGTSGGGLSRELLYVPEYGGGSGYINLSTPAP